MTEPNVQIGLLRERIEAGGAHYLDRQPFDRDEYEDRKISPNDQETLLEFSDELQLLRSEYSDERHLKLLSHLTNMAERTDGVARTLESREAAEDLVRWINATYDNEETNQDMRVALRVFGRRVGTVEEPNRDYPPSIEWIPTGTSSTYDPTPEPSEMLRWEDDVIPMIKATRFSRDAAMIAVAFDAGPRGGEFHTLRVGDVTDSEYGMQITVRGKQGKRTVDLIPSVYYLNSWLADHPSPEDPEAPLWSKLSKSEPVSYRMLTKPFKKAAKNAGVAKEVTLTNFRKSSAAYLASQGVSHAHLCEHHGWVKTSKAAARYISVFSEDTTKAIARAHGKEIEEKSKNKTAPITCPRCHKETPRERQLCVHCGQALEPEAAEKAERVDDILIQAIAQAGPDRANELLEMRSEVKESPELVTDLVDEIAPLLESESH